MTGLSKSKYAKFCQCPKALWLSEYHKELAVITLSDQERFELGNKVGDLAMGLLGDFEEVTTLTANKLNLKAMIAKTQDCISRGVENICEASFSFSSSEFGSNYCAVDILHKTDNGYAIYEVKSSTGDDSKSSNTENVLGKYALDIAYQKWVLDRCGINVTGCYLVRLNKQYTLEGKLDTKALFHITNMDKTVADKYAMVESNIKAANAILANGDVEPHCNLGNYCNSPYKCDFWNYCSRNLPKPSVFDLYNSRKKFDFYNSGIVSFDQLDKSALTPIQKMQVEGVTHIDKDGIAKFMGTLHYPLYFLDFETIQPAIPEYQKSHPFQQIPTQYSLHYIETEGGELKHKEFLGNGDSDPRRELAERLCQDIPLNVCTVAYNKSFECGRIGELALLYPDLSEHLLNIQSHIVDLLEPFQSGYYYLPAMNGSFSIKSVLPALFPDDPELDYHNLPGCVHNGGEAMNIFPKLKEMSPEERERTRKALLTYCQLDTFAMVKVWEKLREVK